MGSGEDLTRGYPEAIRVRLDKEGPQRALAHGYVCMYVYYCRTVRSFVASATGHTGIPYPCLSCRPLTHPASGRIAPNEI